MQSIIRSTLSAVPLVLGLSVGALAQSWPSEPVHIVVPYAPGSTGEVVARLVGEAIEPELGQPVVVETRPGGGGNVGAAEVANAEPDGHTLLLAATNNLAINQFLFDLPFDPMEAFEPVTNVLDVPSVIISNPSVPAETLQEFVDYAKAHPGELSYASPSIGTTPHLAVEQLKQMTGIDLVHIPYGGGGPAVTGLLSNEVQLYLVGSVLAKPHIESGAANGLAVGSKERLATLPDVPTTAEAGFEDYRPSNWWGLAAPKGTPQEVIDRLHDLVAGALEDPELQARLTELGLVPIGSSPEEFAEQIRAEAELWSKTIEAGGITIQ